MSEDDKPGVDLSVRDVMCARHGEPFRHKWPTGYLIFSLELAKAALNTSEELHEVTGGDAFKLNAVIAEFGPLCRLVTADQRYEAFLATAQNPEFGRTNLCVACRKWEVGTLCSWTVPEKGVRTKHVCFRCIADAECGD